jgi:signal transduction histidine kinase
MPQGHLPVRSYMAAPVRSHSGEVFGGLFFGHQRPGVFDESAEDVLRGIAGWASIAMDNAKLYEAAQQAARELAIRASELATVLEVAPVGIGIARDVECRHVEVNREFSRMLNIGVAQNGSLSATDSERPPFRVLRDGEEVDPKDLPMQVAARTGQPTEPVQLQLIFDDGQVRHEYGSAAPIYDADGTVRGSVGAFVDVTELQRLQDELRDALDAKDEFLGLVSHELRTPLTVIRGNAGVLANKNSRLDDAQKHEALGDIVQESERLHRIIENLLLIARAERGIEPDVEPLFVVRIVRNVIQRHQQQYRDRQFEIVEHEAPKPVEFSAASLDQLIENLVTNAEKYSPAGGRIVVDIERRPNEVIIRVLDEGPGLGDTPTEHLFEPFFRSASGRRRAAGLGIGLAVCKRLVEAHHGRIWAQNRQEGGAEFGFSLPVIETPFDPLVD